MIKKNFVQWTAAPLLIACFLTAGCSQAVLSSNKSTNNTQLISELQIVIETESSNTDSTENAQTPKTSSPVDPPSSSQLSEHTLAQTEFSSEIVGTSAPAETTSLAPIGENSPSKEENTSQTDSNDIQVLDGYTLMDGMATPVQVEFQIVDIKRGEAAYTILSANQPNLPTAEAGMEYIVITFNINYKSGEADLLTLEQSNASLDAARLSFYLSNGDSNAEQLTNLLPDNIYNLSLGKGSSGTGSVAFLHKADSAEPLRFIGFDDILEFSINE